MVSRGEELLISADSHIVEDPHFWENQLPAAFKYQAPVFPEREVGGLFQAHPGGWDPHERVKEMAVDGVSGEVLYPSFAMSLFGTPGRRPAGGLLPGLQRLDPGVLLFCSRPPLRCVLYLHLRH